VEYWINALLVRAEELAPLAQAADELGFAGLALADHSVMPEVIESQYPGGRMPWDASMTWPDVWVQIGALAALTTRLRFTTNVYVLPARHPLVVARAVCTAAVISGDRVILGVGVGWMSEEFEAMGQRFDNRGARANESLEILRMAFSGEPVEYQGKHYRIPKLHLNPTPGKPPPVWVGGDSPAALRRAARLADGWICGGDPSVVEERLPALQRELEAVDRSAEAFTLVSSVHQAPRDAELERWSALGIGHLKVQPWAWEADRSPDLDAKIRALRRFAAGYIDG
jgi:probable F420-dependent oxidoreductase